MWWKWVLCVLVPYLLGSISFGVLYARRKGHDIRAEGLGQVQLAFQDIDHDDLIGAFELGALGDDLPGIAGTHDDDGVAELHAGVETGEHGAGGGLTERRDVHIQAYILQDIFCKDLIHLIIFSKQNTFA